MSKWDAKSIQRLVIALTESDKEWELMNTSLNNVGILSTRYFNLLSSVFDYVDSIREGFRIITDFIPVTNLVNQFVESILTNMEEQVLDFLESVFGSKINRRLIETELRKHPRLGLEISEDDQEQEEEEDAVIKPDTNDLVNWIEDWRGWLLQDISNNSGNEDEWVRKMWDACRDLSNRTLQRAKEIDSYLEKN